MDLMKYYLQNIFTSLYFPANFVVSHSFPSPQLLEV